MDHSLPSPQNTKPLFVLDLDAMWHPVFFQSVQFVEALAQAPSTPRAAAIYALFLQAIASPARADLVTWLEKYISNFVADDPSTQTDQVEKLIAIATYTYLCFDNDVYPRHPYLPYIEYAAQLNWLNDSLLAFMCWQVRDNVKICEKAKSYFLENLNIFLQKNRSRELSQLLLVAADGVSAYDEERIMVTLRNTTTDSSVSIQNLSWTMLALGNLRNPSPTIVVTASGRLLNQLQDTLSNIFRNSKIIEAVVAVWNDPHNTIVRFSNTEPTSSGADIEIPITNIEDAFAPAPIDIALSAYALYKTGTHQIVSLPMHTKTDVSNAINHYMAHSKGHIYISKVENFILNFMVLALTFIIGYSLLLLNSDGQITFTGTIDVFSPDITPGVIAFVLLLGVEISMTLFNKPITKILDLIPLLRETLDKLFTKKDDRV